MAECRGNCKMPKLANLDSCVAQCAACGRYWELRAAWVPYTKLGTPSSEGEGEAVVGRLRQQSTTRKRGRVGTG